MDKDYEYYLLGCRSAGVEPMEESQFRLVQSAFLYPAAGTAQDLHDDLIPPSVLERLAAMVAEGQRIAAGGGAEGDEPGAAACGVREPRVPLEPVLVGCAARPLPIADAPDESFWRV